MATSEPTAQHTPATDTAERNTSGTVDLTAAALLTLSPAACLAVGTQMDDIPAVINAALVAGAGACTAAGARLAGGHTTLNLPETSLVRRQAWSLVSASGASLLSLLSGFIDGAAGPDALLSTVFAPSWAQAGYAVMSGAWWAATGFTVWSLRKQLLYRQPAPTPTPAPEPAAPQEQPSNPVVPQQISPTGSVAQILHLWQYIGGPNGVAPDHLLKDVDVAPDGSWTGRVRSPLGKTVSSYVNQGTLAQVYAVPDAWVTVAEGFNSGERIVAVRAQAPAPTAGVDDSTPQGVWAAYVAAPGRPLPGTTLENIGVNTPEQGGGWRAYVRADRRRVPTPDLIDLAAALGVERLSLISYVTTSDPTRAIVRVMDRNPLEDGMPIPTLDALTASTGGYIPIGRYVTMTEVLIQLCEPGDGAKHMMIAGATGSGKSALIEVIALACHANGYALVLADPKGNSFRKHTYDMAAVHGFGIDGSMNALRTAHAKLKQAQKDLEGTGENTFTHTPQRPLTVVVLDEASRLLNKNSPVKDEAVAIVDDFASLGRALGFSLVLANQIVNLDQLGGSQAVRTNLIGGGTLVMLRTSSGQKHLADLPDEFGHIDPSQIPQTWVRELSLDGIPDGDPRRTYGLGYGAGPGAMAEMMRTSYAPDLATLFDPARVVRLDLTDIDTTTPAHTTPPPTAPATHALPHSTAAAAAPVKETVEDKVLAVLRETGGGALRRKQILDLTGAKDAQLDRVLKKLRETGAVINPDGIEGLYALPTDNN
ncbi:type IV secretory system conjugative DNA transfer family protein [Streptomyces microflavus]|uniref:type IV secretory system conjugative DNA transfer family protein n=1 Tax=Streptomyces microflavus TaxID=1919 RepID=UPI0036497D36